MPRILVVGTADTKAPELAYLTALLRQGPLEVMLIDVGTRPAAMTADIPAKIVAACHPEGTSAVLGLNDRG